MFWSGAVAKVPPPVGSVKYKAQPIVLSVQIPLFTGHSQKEGAGNQGFGCGRLQRDTRKAGLLQSMKALLEGRRNGRVSARRGVVDRGGKGGKDGVAYGVDCVQNLFELRSR